MRWKYFVIALLSSSIAGLALYALVPHQQNGDAEIAIETALKKQSSDFTTLLHDRLKDLESSLQLTFSQWSEKDNTSLLKTSDPFEALFYKNTLVKKARVDLSDEFASFFSKQQEAKKLSFWKHENESYIIWNSIYQGERFSVALKTSAWLSDLASGVIKNWGALDNGTFIYHSDPHFLGMDFANSRPISLALQAADGQSIPEISSYQNIEGRQVLGAWNTIPAWGIITGSEWALPWWGEKKNATLMYGILGALFLSGFLFAKSFQKKQLTPTIIEEKKNLSDPEAKEYIQKAVSSAKTALNYANEMEQHTEQMQKLVTETQWAFEVVEQFWTEAQEKETTNALLEHLGTSISALTFSSPTIIFRYSAISCSLIPAYVAASETAPLRMKDALNEERIYIGSPQAYQRIAESEAWTKWLTRIEPYLNMEQFTCNAIPLENKNVLLGLVVIFISNDLDSDQAISKQKPLWEKMVQRTTWLYDIKQRLLQYQHAGKSSTKNLARNQPRAT